MDKIHLFYRFCARKQNCDVNSNFEGKLFGRVIFWGHGQVTSVVRKIAREIFKFFFVLQLSKKDENYFVKQQMPLTPFSINLKFSNKPRSYLQFSREPATAYFGASGKAGSFVFDVAS